MDSLSEPLEGFDGFLTELAKAADVCFRPHRHSLRFVAGLPEPSQGTDDCRVVIEVRDPAGSRVPAADLELEIYRSGTDVNVMLTKTADEGAPLLWQGSHPVWMHASTGERCEPPADAGPMEAFGRRIRSFLQTPLG